MAFDLTGQPCAARTLVTLIRFYLMLQLSGRIQMIRLVDAPIQQIDTSLRCSVMYLAAAGKYLRLTRQPL